MGYSPKFDDDEKEDAYDDGPSSDGHCLGGAFDASSMHLGDHMMA